MNKYRLLIFVFIFSLFLSFSNLKAGTILSSYKYAWSNNVGYINFENVTISDSKLSGFAWSSSKGFIKFDPAQGGVLNDGKGNLSGFAWGEGLGWIDFNNVLINSSTGKFSGSATGTLVGTINFDCPNYCDIRTDWRESVATSSVQSGGGSWFINTVLNTFTPSSISVQNQPLVINPNQSGVLTQEDITGKIVIDIPADSLIKKTTFIISPEPVISTESKDLIVKGTELINNSFYNVTATDENGQAVHFFSKPISIILPIPLSFLNKKNLGVYWLNETNWQWVLIPDAIFTGNEVNFKVSHLTKFAIFEKTKDFIENLKIITPNLIIPVSKKSDKSEDLSDVGKTILINKSLNTSIVKTDINTSTSTLIVVKKEKDNNVQLAKKDNNLFSLILIFTLISFLIFTLAKTFSIKH